MTEDRCREAGVFLRALFAPYPSGYAEFRFLRGGFAGVPAWLEMPVSGERLRRAVEMVMEQDAQGWDCYVGVLPRSIKSGKSEYIESAAWFWADLDYKLGRREDIDALADAADMVVRSGNGVHAYVRLDQPVAMTTARERKRFAGACRKWQIGLHPNADSTADLARILRVPGTRNHKGSTPSPVVLVRTPGKAQPVRSECFSPKDTETRNTQTTGGGARPEEDVMPADLVELGAEFDERVGLFLAAQEDALPLFRPPLVMTSGRICSDPNVALRGILQQCPEWAEEDTAQILARLKGLGYAC